MNRERYLAARTGDRNYTTVVGASPSCCVLKTETVTVLHYCRGNQRSRHCGLSRNKPLRVSNKRATLVEVTYHPGTRSLEARPKRSPLSLEASAWCEVKAKSCGRRARAWVSGDGLHRRTPEGLPRPGDPWALERVKRD